MLADKREQPPTPSFFGHVLSVLIKAAVLIVLLFVFDKLLPSISQQTQSFVVAKWQQLSLLQQELPTEDSLPNPLPGQNLTDTWGAARSQGRSHEGIDIFAARGTPIQSATQGIVRKVGENNLGGRVVVVVGPGGAGHYYAHLEDYADIAPDNWVDVGDTIGYVGDSGNAKGTPPHLHYGIYINGSAVNPYPLLQKK
ncbi:MAG: M23 family metallopeptidase [Psychrobacter sp.]|uniref:M23 family metallopeptidase n=1 Tax=unclassified Psychrobacter TaxID=196806 RepID=UPI001787A34F|nr:MULTISPECIES: M23 family metallopeptidase [unclassified Psychrobacter]MBE0442655.1 M23 family metallopeptidase [Psychrobacter sp. FME13]